MPLLTNPARNRLFLLGGGLATLEAPPEVLPTISVADAVVIEGGTAAVVISREFASALPASITYTMANGTATSGVDFFAASGTATIPAFATSVTLSIPTILRADYQPARAFTVTLTGATIGASPLVIVRPTSTITITDTDLPEGDDGYYQSLIALPQMYIHRSLRSLGELLALTNETSLSKWSYDPATDTHPDAQDAAKFTVGPPGVNAGEEIMDFTFGTSALGIPQVHGGSVKVPVISGSQRLLLTFDVYYTSTFRTDYGAVTSYKLFQFEYDGKGWWTHMGFIQAAAGAYPDDPVAMTSGEAIRLNTPWPAGMTQRDGPFHPQGAQLAGWPSNGDNLADGVPQIYGGWTRYWFEIILDQPPSAFTEWNAAMGVTVGASTQPALGGNWVMGSVWTANATSGPTRVLYRAPLGVENTADLNRITKWRVELNSSKSGITAPWVLYMRNVVFLKDYILPSTNPEADTTIFQRPT